MGKGHRLSLNIRINAGLLQDVQRLVLSFGMLGLFGLVCYRAVIAGRLDQILPLITGLMGMVLGYYFAAQTKKQEKPDSSSPPSE